MTCRQPGLCLTFTSNVVIFGFKPSLFLLCNRFILKCNEMQNVVSGEIKEKCLKSNMSTSNSLLPPLVKYSQKHSRMVAYIRKHPALCDFNNFFTVESRRYSRVSPLLRLLTLGLSGRFWLHASLPRFRQIGFLWP